MTDPNPDADDYYERLGVAPDASMEELERAASIAKARHDPGPLDSGDEEQWYRIKEAIETLTDPDAREAYDRGGPDASPGPDDESSGASGDGPDGEATPEPGAADYETPAPSAEDLYARIGVSPDADRVEVMKAAAEAKAAFDPGRMASVSDEDVERWERVRDAVDVLVDAERRASYDERRSG